MNISSIHPAFLRLSRLASRVRRAHRFMGDGCGARGAGRTLQIIEFGQVKEMLCKSKLL